MPTLYDAEGNEVEIPDNPNELRNQLAEAQKVAKEAEKARIKAESELEPIRKAQKELIVNQAFTEAGLGEREAKVFLRLNPDSEVTPESIASFSEEFGFAPKEPEKPAPTAPAPQAQTFRPTSEATPVGVTPEEWPAFMARVMNPSTHDQALKDFAEGRVETPSGKDYAGRFNR